MSTSQRSGRKIRSRGAAEHQAGFTFPGFDLPAAIRAELENTPAIPRSQATRQRLLIAAAELMQDVGFNGLKVADICSRAGFAHGTFYLHWRDRRGVAYDVLTALMRAIRSHRPPRQHDQSFYERLVVGHLYYIDVYRRNAGLMRCQGQLADQLEGFAQIGLDANLEFAKRLVRAVESELRESADKIRDKPALRATALACIAMVDKLLHEIFIRGLDIGLDDHALASMLSITWYRSLLGRDIEVT